MLENIRPAKTDEAVARRVQEGDTESFSLLVERYEEKLTRYARKFLFWGEDVKDLVQDVFLKAYSNMQSFDAARRFSPWIYRIAHNVYLNAARKRGKEAVAFFDLDVLFPHPASPETAEGEADRKELRQMLDAHLGLLDLKYREPLILYYFEDMDYRQIAEVLRLPVSTVGVRLRRGKELLRRSMNQP